MRYWVVFLLAVSLVAAFEPHDEVVINSKDWKDIYSGMLYAELMDSHGNYLIDESRGYLLIDTIGQEGKNVLLLESDTPYIANFQSDLSANGLSIETYSDFDNLNLDLLEELNVQKIIVMDERYSYNAVSLAPYAILEGYYVVFADSENIETVIEILDTINPTDVIIYGYVDRDVETNLQRFNPQTINLGNKYANNLEIVKRFTEKQKFTQYVLTSGNFIEPQFFTDVSPVVFIGNTNIPEETMKFLNDSKIKHAILIGNNLYPLGTQLKSEADMRIMIKFAKGVNKIQYSLDTIALPVFEFVPVIKDIQYNQLTKQLIAIIENTGPSPFHGRATYTILDGENSVAELGDETSFFVGPNSIVTRTYDVDLTGLSDLMVRMILVYGEDVGALENILQQELDLTFTQFDDKSKISLVDIEYDNRIKRFIVEIKNTGADDVYVLPILQEVIVNNKPETLAAEETMIEPGKTAKIKIKARLTPEDIEDNKEISVMILYGGKENQLVNTLNDVVEFKIKSYAFLISAGIIILISIVIIVLLLKKRKKPSRPAPPPRH